MTAGAILFGVANRVHIHLKPTSMCGVSGGGGGGGAGAPLMRDSFAIGEITSLVV